MFRGGRQGPKRGRGGASSYRGDGNGRPSSQSRGLFTDAIWHCDCSPRVPAEHFKVKKEGKNQGRWIYTCQQQEPKRCGFFLWDEDAKPREEAAVLSNSRTEPEAKKDGVQKGWAAGRVETPASGNGWFAKQAQDQATNGDDTDSPTPSPDKHSGSLATIGTKRSAHTAQLDENDDDEFWSQAGVNDEDLVNLADAAVPQTPQRAQKTGVYATPATTGKRKLPWLEESNTPITMRSNLNDFITPSKPPADVLAQSTSEAQHDVSAVNPTSAESRQSHVRHRDALNNSADASSSLTQEVLAELSAVTVTPEALSRIRSILTKHDLKAQGVAKGRDITRLAVKAKDAKIAELAAKVSSLEAERELERAVIRRLTWENKQLGSS